VQIRSKVSQGQKGSKQTYNEVSLLTLWCLSTRGGCSQSKRALTQYRSVYMYGESPCLRSIYISAVFGVADVIERSRHGSVCVGYVEAVMHRETYLKIILLTPQSEECRRVVTARLLYTCSWQETRKGELQTAFMVLVQIHVVLIGLKNLVHIIS
jgi:hypothetical protein